MNECHFMGNLTHDPKFQNVGSKGTAVVNFDIAVSRKYKRQNGEVVKEVTYIPLEAWDSGAETIQRHFKKGSPIIVHCSVRNETWDDKATGQKRSRMKFRVNKFEFVPSAKSSQDIDTDGVNDNEGITEPDGNGGDIPF